MPQINIFSIHQSINYMEELTSPSGHYEYYQAKQGTCRWAE